MKVFFADSFTNVPFKGNPAAVVLLDRTISTEKMQMIASEIGYSETAFLLKEENDQYLIRFFTPKQELMLCGHATLASAYVLFQMENNSNLVFRNTDHQRFELTNSQPGVTMFFPAYAVESFVPPPQMLEAIGIKAYKEGSYNRELKIVMIEIAEASLLKKLTPDFIKLENSYSGIHGVLVTARGNEEGIDFVYRYFWPWAGTNEDPVTGGVQTFLTPYWATRLSKNQMVAVQPSARTGRMKTAVSDDRISIVGEVVITMEGELKV
jgi:PhzF family phenazine biosynthesis protein